jgi:cellulose synthase/poly-beta-1,6-N-acetylglucosamine synthase-like glycosyltransferase
MVDLITCAVEMWRALACAVSLPWLVDAGFRRLLAWAARARHSEHDAVPATHLRWTVVVPARSEGPAVSPSLASIVAAAHGHHVRTVLLLDGSDHEAEHEARDLGIPTVTKESPGPSKGAALGWFVENCPDLLEETDAVLILDVGSRLSPGFFSLLSWPRGADALQARLRGEGAGIGQAASLSESTAQQWQDRGRQALGWSVQLRGTGTAFTPAALRTVAPRLRTSVEDTEATLLLAAGGGCSALGGEQAWVEDLKPEMVADAARQRARWLVGQLAVVLRQPGALLRLTARSPIEGIAFTAGLLSRPLSVTAFLRLVLATACAADGLVGSGGPLALAASGFLLASLISDVALLRRTTGARWGQLASAGAHMLLAWSGAFLLIPRALFGWVRARRS